MTSTTTASANGEMPFPDGPNCYALARVANRFIALGEERALEGMASLVRGKEQERLHRYDQAIQIGWICRLIFESRSDGPLRAPMYGQLDLPWHSMPISKWPYFPLAESDGLFFVLSSGYLVAGHPEDPVDYINYCRESGSFRVTRIKIPSESEAEAALDSLLSSEIWLNIKWKDEKWYPGGGGWFHDLSPESTIAYLRRQTKWGNKDRGINALSRESL